MLPGKGLQVEAPAERSAEQPVKQQHSWPRSGLKVAELVSLDPQFLAFHSIFLYCHRFSPKRVFRSPNMLKLNVIRYLSPPSEDYFL